MFGRNYSKPVGADALGADDVVVHGGDSAYLGASLVPAEAA